ncbi:hypothetical protein PC116_g20840 [Phytophthora cactorum]|nr:hypothetical protein PC121_g17664 [Phytophthora cactorum]KAG4230875.1 hypothetical protein PC116_g20840 [Phytophthora cactorum]
MMLYRVYLCRPAFHQLLHRFTEFYTIPNLNSRGRPAKLRYHHRILGLVLSFYVESMEQSTLWTLFGAPTSTFSRTLRRAEEALSKALNGYAPVRISWPSPAHQVLPVNEGSTTCSRSNSRPTRTCRMRCVTGGYTPYLLRVAS